MGQTVKAIIQRGELVPDATVFELVRLNVSSDALGIVFDGFPRTIAQAEYLLDHYQLQKVFYLDLSETTAIQRISARRVCQSCGENYNLNSQPPHTKDICDKCGGLLIIRNDDKPDAISKRFAEFYEQTSPLKEFFIKHNLLVNIKAEGTVQDIFDLLKVNLASR